MEKQSINELISKAKASNQSKTVQKVIPVKSSQNEEVQFSFYLSKQLLKKVKLKALKEDEKIKTIINKALELYLEVN
ncbi:hypothetical protein [Gelidibacter pelagius]|uniref:CopG family transcriptional regulator n=1 Tax=Gelidibacter pelagius TaxID=2819985 RepID=A0ABS3SRP9_9FLAO|nr:hypothetical protein [Gelidibacter pelagius]MBO3097612.1 hypothetical protein [Gelidibacter pelagius]